MSKDQLEDLEPEDADGIVGGNPAERGVDRIHGNVKKRLPESLRDQTAD